MQTIFIIIKYENVNTKGIKQGGKIRLYLKLMLNKLNVIGDLPLFIPLWRFSFFKKTIKTFIKSYQRTFLKAFIIVN